MKIIFDCGSTKTSVAIISSDSPTLHLDLANGYNALTGGDNELRTLISSHPAMDPSRTSARQIHYYGAGCATHRHAIESAHSWPAYFHRPRYTSTATCSEPREPYVETLPA